MSGVKKLLFGGIVCCLIISLVIPVTSNSGSGTQSEASAGFGPKFRKPWLKKSSSKKKSSNSQKKSSNRNPSGTQKRAVPSEQNAQSPVMQELQEIYRENGQEAPAMNGYPQARTQVQPHPEKKSKNFFGRVYDKITGKSSKQKPHTNRPPTETLEPLPEWDEQKMAPVEENNTAEFNPFDSSDSDNVIIPPSPQPNLLPEFNSSDIEAVQPLVTEGSTMTPEQNDPFPLPPLPDEVDAMSKQASKSPTPEKKQAAAPSFVIDLPLPGIDLSTESGVTATEPEVNFEPQKLEQKTEFVEAQPEPLPEPDVPMPIEEVNVVQEIESPSETEGMARIIVDHDPSQEAEQEFMVPEDQGFEVSGPAPVIVSEKPKGRKNTLPPAPSAVEYEAPESEPVVIESLPSSQGWRSRGGQPQRLEPNAFNAPSEARPASELNPAVVHQESPAEKYRRISERGKRTGFKGFCPVVLRDSLGLVDASPEFRIEYEGAIYYLSSEEAMNQFKTDPTRYAPAWGGIDLVKFDSEGVEESGRLDFAVWYHDRLHLFSTQQSMEQFKASPESFIPQE